MTVVHMASEAEVVFVSPSSRPPLVRGDAVETASFSPITHRAPRPRRPGAMCMASFLAIAGIGTCVGLLAVQQVRSRDVGQQLDSLNRISLLTLSKLDVLQRNMEAMGMIASTLSTSGPQKSLLDALDTVQNQTTSINSSLLDLLDILGIFNQLLSNGGFSAPATSV